jgi:peptidoglycan hydrolase CwlO-like protein
MSGKVIMEKSEYDELHMLAHESKEEIERLSNELEDIKHQKKIVLVLEGKPNGSMHVFPYKLSVVSKTEPAVVGWINDTVISINALQDQMNILTEELAKKDKLVDKYKQIKKLFMDND